VKITQATIPLVVRQTAETLENAGFEAYLVGGCVRDLLRGADPKDWDLTTNAHPEQITALFRDHYANNDYGTIGVKTDSEDVRHQIIEVTPYRSESGYSDLRRPDNVTFGVSLDEDLGRRDFTVNALAYRVKTETLVDHFDGLQDLKDKRLKTVGDAHDRFNEDALRY
jgi:tRNA nucleotidyltransferase/poly(A) polymerase